MAAPGFDIVKFKNAQRSLWDTVTDKWSALPPEFAKGAEELSDKLFGFGDVRAGHRVLDLACGAGDLALAAADRAGPDGRVLGIDLAPGMVAAARKRAGDRTGIEFAEADLDALDLPPASFDVALSRWGLMFSAEPEKLFRSLHELLSPGGVLAAAVWGPEESAPMMALGAAVFTTKLGLVAPPPGAPGPFAMSDAGQVREQLAAAGFGSVSVSEIVVRFQLSSARRYAEFTRDITPPPMLGMIRETFGDENAPEIWDAVAEAAEPYADADGTVTMPSTNLLIRATR
ncbi:class I SAM-dependent methyltransferase [Amycolatopsis sp. WGS_07]|uniref:class I SAM-dependent methyltransferase n=1 Tax=Amycolatopsis sp. WGS_07 TaxID=3076764 RepID=UPI0038737ECA